MPVSPTYPGVYVEEIPSGVRTITGVATSVTAFIGRAKRGPVNAAIVINSFGDFERIFGGLWSQSSLGFAVRDFFLNGGSQAVIVRLFHPTFATDADRQSAFDRAKTEAKTAAEAVAKAATDAAAVTTPAPTPQSVAAAATGAVTTAGAASAAALFAAKAVAKAATDAAAVTTPAPTPQSVATAATGAVTNAIDAASKDSVPVARAQLPGNGLELEAANEGSWGNTLKASIDTKVSMDVAKRMGLTEADLFNLTVQDTAPGGITEKFLNVSVADGPRRVDKVLEAESKLVQWKDNKWPTTPPTFTQGEQTVSTLASDGKDLTKVEDFTPDQGIVNKRGLYALEQLFAKDQLFNILCIPPYTTSGDVDVTLISDAAAYCETRRAMLIVDPPTTWVDKTKAVDGFTAASDQVGTRSKNAALFFPRLRQPNPLRDNRFETFVPCGTVAGIFARTDTQRGVWKAPAGVDATLVGVPQLSVPLTDAENGELNQLGVNCLRAFPVAGRVVWGARTLRGADQLADEWKYIPVRRTALYIEESLFRGLKWVVFEPNDEPLWAQIRLNVGAFMHNLFRQGAFQGKTPREAYFVKCDKETTTQTDVNLGIVNIVVGFAPLKPAEFVIIKLQQMAGQIEV